MIENEYNKYLGMFQNTYNKMNFIYYMKEYSNTNTMSNNLVQTLILSLSYGIFSFLILFTSVSNTAIPFL